MNTSELVRALRQGDLDLIDHVSELCDRIERMEDKILALVAGSYDRGRVIGDARKLLIKYPDPDSRPPLFGLGLGVKDIFHVPGFPTRCGSQLPPEFLEGSTSTCFAQLAEAGCILIAKTVTTEFACFEPGPTRNPHDLAHSPGGSSSGSAAGVACGFFPLALGTQTAGSISRPAAYCGIVGFKPSYEMISRQGVFPFSPSADHVGILALDVAGVRLAFGAVAGSKGDKTPDNPTPVDLRALTFGIPEGPYLKQASANGQHNFENILARLVGAGLRVKRLPAFEDIEQINSWHRDLIAGEMARVHEPLLSRFRHLYKARTLEFIETGRRVSDGLLDELRTRRLQLRSDFDRQTVDDGIDFWLSPSTTDHAPPSLETTGNPTMSLPWTFMGVPTLSLFAGLDAHGLPHGLPHGLHVAGRYGTDHSMLARLEALETWMGPASIRNVLP